MRWPTIQALPVMTGSSAAVFPADVLGKCRRRCRTGWNVSEHTSPHCCRYERQVKELKAELAMRDMLNGRSAVNYGDLSEAEAVELQALVRRFLQGGEQASLVAVRKCRCLTLCGGSAGSKRCRIGEACGRAWTRVGQGQDGWRPRDACSKARLIAPHLTILTTACS